MSCSPLHYIHKIESDRRIKKTETKNFAEEKALTQWWYYDCIFEDGSVLVFLFTPCQWWDDTEKIPANKSLFYLSYMNANGEVISQKKVFDFKEIQYTKNSIKSPCFEIKANHEGHGRKYSIDFRLDSIAGSLKIKSDQKAFSPFPRGSLSSTLASIIKRNAKGLSYQYSAHIPEGMAKCNLEVRNSKLELNGKAYHEQGRFTGTPDRMGKGWTWFHFVSKNLNIFGTTGQFICLDNHGKREIGGFEKDFSFSEISYSTKQKNLMVGGKLNYNSKKMSFELKPTTKPSTPMIVIPSFDTEQLWGSVLQETIVKFQIKKTVVEEKGMMFMETCRMKK